MAPGALVRFVLSALLGGGLLYADIGMGAFDQLRGHMAAALTPFRAVARFPEDAVVSAGRAFSRPRGPAGGARRLEGANPQNAGARQLAGFFSPSRTTTCAAC